MGSGGSVPTTADASSCSRSSPTTWIDEESRGRASRLTEAPSDSQGPSPYATLRRDETWWQRRPTAPSLPPSVCDHLVDAQGSAEINEQRETLLTYAAQMTGWSTSAGGGSGKHLDSSADKETMDLSRTISCLATANQQLASAHAMALAHLESLYHDMRMAKASSLSSPRVEVAANENEENRRTRFYIDRLEAMLIDRENMAVGTTKRERRTSVECQRSTVRDGASISKNFARREESEGNDVNMVGTTDDPLRGIGTEEKERITRVADGIDSSTEQESVDAERDAAEEGNSQASEMPRDFVGCGERDGPIRLDGVPEDPGPSERTKLIEELEKSRAETEVAKLRIASLEQELRKSTAERDQARSADSQKSTKLRAQLAEEVSDKKRQIKALEEALDEIQRLKLVVKHDTRENASSDEEERRMESGVSRSATSLVTDGVYDDEDDDVVDDGIADTEHACGVRATNMEEFRKELTLKREARQRAIAAVSSEMDRLRRELGAEREAHSETARMLELLKSSEPERMGLEQRRERVASSAEQTRTMVVEDETEVRKRLEKELEEERRAHQDTLRRMAARRIADATKVSDELRSLLYHEAEKLEDLRYNLERDGEKHEHRISQLKEAVTTTRKSMMMRERQVNKLKDQLAQTMARLDGRGIDFEVDETGAEFDRQLENLKSLRALREIRLKIVMDLGEHATSELLDTRSELEMSRKKIKALEEDLKASEEKLDAQDTEISNLESQLGLTKADCRDLENQMSVINSLFTQMLLSASSADMDLDRLTRLLQENHDLISEMAREEGTEAAALPKLLLDLVEQVEGRKNDTCGTANDAEEKRDEGAHEENIAHNLPKVWRVLLELLSCHAVEAPSTSLSALTDPESCYKSVDTPTGPQLVISVSKTYIRLKELILEKKQLEKEMTRMKQLNTHLESKLGEQEKRLSTVSSELSKTWNIVGRMQAQHQQLHTHEKILRYELQQKRKMLQELKQELEYCREKWESARQKNTTTELEWKSLRREFAARKSLAAQDSLNNSGESGFSDERGDESDEEDSIATERIRISPRRRTRKENPRVSTPDTESEQPTDGDLRICSSEIEEQRTPTPETETETEMETETEAESRVRIGGPTSSSESQSPIPEAEHSSDAEVLDPLDRALTNVIHSLIRIDGVTSPSTVTTSRESIAMPSTSSMGGFQQRSASDVSSDEETKHRNSKWTKEARAWSPCSEPWSSTSRASEMKPNSTSSLWKSRRHGSRGSCDRAIQGSLANVDSAANEPIVTEMNNDAPIFETLDLPDNVTTTNRSLVAVVDAVDTADEEIAKRPELREGETMAETESTRIPATSIFSIGPYPPTTKSPTPTKTVQFKEPLVAGPSRSISPPLFGGAAPTDEQLPSNDSLSIEKTHRSSSTDEICAVSSAAVDNETSSRSIEVTAKDAQTDSNRLIETDGIEAETKTPTSPELTTVAADSVADKGEERKKDEEIRRFDALTNVESSAAPASSSQLVTVPTPRNVTRTPEEVLAARAARLKRLEEQADWLMKKMNATSQRGSALSTRLEELHETYGEPPAPPPLPDVLPAVRIRTSLREERQQRESSQSQRRQEQRREQNLESPADHGEESNALKSPENGP